MRKLNVTLLTGRTIDQGTSKEHGKLSEEYRDNVAICEMDSNDLDELECKENCNVRVSTKHGSVIVKAKKSRRAPHPKIAYMPYGFWANLLIAPETHGTGMPSFKGIAAIIELAPTEDVSSLPQLLKQSLRKGKNADH